MIIIQYHHHVIIIIMGNQALKCLSLAGFSLQVCTPVCLYWIYLFQQRPVLVQHELTVYFLQISHNSWLKKNNKKKQLRSSSNTDQMKPGWWYD